MIDAHNPRFTIQHCLLSTSTADTHELAKKFMPKTDPPSLGGWLIRGSVFEVVYLYYSDDNKIVRIQVGQNVNNR